MKKILILLLAFSAITFSSCSSDDNGGGSSSVVKFKIGGQQKTFKFVTVSSTGGNEVWVVSAPSQAGAESMSFDAVKGDPTSDSVGGFMYTANAEMYDSEGVLVTVTQNTETVLKGTFSGTFTNFDSEEITVTDGSFEIYY